MDQSSILTTENFTELFIENVTINKFNCKLLNSDLNEINALFNFGKINVN